MAENLRFAIKSLGTESQTLREVLTRRTPEQTALDAIQATKLFSVKERKRLTGSPQSIQNRDGVLLRLIRFIEPEALKVRK